MSRVLSLTLIALCRCTISKPTVGMRSPCYLAPGYPDSGPEHEHTIGSLALTATLTDCSGETAILPGPRTQCRAVCPNPNPGLNRRTQCGAVCPNPNPSLNRRTQCGAVCPNPNPGLNRRTQCGAVCIDSFVYVVGGLTNKTSRTREGLEHRTRYSPGRPYRGQRESPSMMVPVTSHCLSCAPEAIGAAGKAGPDITLEWKALQGWGKPGAALAFAS